MPIHPKTRGRRRALGARVAALAVALAVAGLAGSARADAFADGQRLFEADRFEAAIDALEKAVEEAPGESEPHRWLGMAYGRVAEHGSWNIPRRILLVDLSRREFERAVELAPDSVDALETLMRFYREAPGIFGGDTEKADAIEKRIEALERARAPRSGAASTN